MPLLSLLFSIVLLMGSSHPVQAQTFDFAAATPEGSWAKREVLTVDHKGRSTVAVMTQKHLGSEQRDGETHYWLETEMHNFKLGRDGERKADGEPVVLKTLVAASALNSDPANAVNNLQGFGKEVIMQSGDQQPMRISGGGSMAGMAMKALGVKVEYQFEEKGRERVETPGGSFDARRIEGSGSASSKMMFRTIDISSESTMWVSEDVPFGLVRGETREQMNGKPQQSTMTLTEYGRSGASSAIVGTPQDMPQMPNLFGN
jgi:hypothetical protein